MADYGGVLVFGYYDKNSKLAYSVGKVKPNATGAGLKNNTPYRVKDKTGKIVAV
jgi:hypothetical protein